MASAWGLSWGRYWGNSWGTVSAEVVGGSSKRRRKLRVRKWSDPVDPPQPEVFLATSKQEAVPQIVLPASTPLSDALEARRKREKRIRMIASMVLSVMDD